MRKLNTTLFLSGMMKKWLTLMTLVIGMMQLSVAQKNLVFVTTNASDLDTTVIQAIEAQGGYNVTPYYPAGDAGLLTDADLPTLDAADVVIMGRRIGSGNIRDAATTWDKIKAPVLSMNVWGMRNSRAKWVNSSVAVNENTNPDTVLQATIQVADDPVFEGITGPTFDLWNGVFSAFGNDESIADDGGNGQVLLTAANGTILFARWDAGKEFYPESGNPPAAPRSFIGNGHDDKDMINYFGFTEDGKKVFFAELDRLAAWEPIKELFFVSTDTMDLDSTVIQAIQAHGGYNVTPYYPAGGVGLLTDADLPILDAADVVIMGRRIKSDNVRDAAAIWDKIKAPVLSMNVWAMRNSKAKWANSSVAVNESSNPDTVLQATIQVADDPVFEGITGPTFDLWNGVFSAFGDDESIADDGGNGQVLLTAANGTILFARWDPWKEFYPESGNPPSGYRSFLGNGHDSNDMFNYFGFTEDGKKVFFAELARMAALERVVPPFSAADYTIEFITPDNRDSVQIDWLKAKGFTVNTWWPAVTTAVTEEEIAKLNAADLVIAGRSGNSSRLGEMTEVLNNVWVPMMNINQFASRSSRMMWFETASTDRIEEADMSYSFEVDSTDALFEGIDFGGSALLDLLTTPQDFLAINDSTLTAGNAHVVAANDSIVAVARFEPNVEYYEGAGKPLGYRMYFGFGNDSSGEILFFSLTDNGKTVYYNALKELILKGATEFRPEVKKDNTKLKELIVGGNVVILEEGVLEYEVSLAAGTTAVPSVTVSTDDDEAKAEVTDAADLSGTTEIVVTAADGTTTVTYKITFSLREAGFNILFVSEDTDADKIIADSLANSFSHNKAYNVDQVTGAIFNTNFADASAYEPYDLVYVSETVGSNNVLVYGAAGFPIPAFYSEPYALHKEGFELGTLNFDAAQADGGDAIEYMNVTNTDHPVTKDMFDAGSIQVFDNSVAYDNGADGDATNDDTWMYEILFADYPNTSVDVLATPDFSKASADTWDGTGAAWMVITDADSRFPPTTKLIVQALHEGAAVRGKDHAFWPMVRSSVKYLLGDSEVELPKTNADLDNKIKIYPNPVTKQELTVAFNLEEAGAVEIKLINSNGQLVKTLGSGIRAAGKNSIPFNVSEISSGIYFVEIQGNKISKTERLIINN